MDMSLAMAVQTSTAEGHIVLTSDWEKHARVKDLLDAMRFVHPL